MAISRSHLKLRGLSQAPMLKGKKRKARLVLFYPEELQLIDKVARAKGISSSYFISQAAVASASRTQL